MPAATLLIVDDESLLRWSLKERLGARGQRDPRSGYSGGLPPGGVNLEDVERQLLAQALERAGGDQSRAAQLLGINRDQVRYRLEKFGLKA